MRYAVRFLLVGFLLLAAAPAWCQRFGYVDTEYILGKMPEYAQAQTELAKLTDTWQKEIAAQKLDIEKMYRTYQAEEVVLTDVMKKKRQDEILLKEKALKEYEAKQFGYEGQLFKKRIELNRPAQDKIFEALEKVAKLKKLDMIFDRNGDLTLLYASPTHDYTEYVMEELGLAKPTQNQPGQKGPIRTITPPKTPDKATRQAAPASTDPAFESDSGAPDTTPAAAGRGTKSAKAAGDGKP